MHKDPLVLTVLQIVGSAVVDLVFWGFEFRAVGVSVKCVLFHFRV